MTDCRASLFAGRCYLCGDPTKGLYCHAHSWAEGTESDSPWAKNADLASKNSQKSVETGSQLEADIRYWLETQTPQQVIELAAGISS